MEMSFFGVSRKQINLMVMLLILVCGSCKCKAKDTELCSRRCGIHNISHPFRLQDSSPKCGDMRYTLSCEGNQLMLYWLFRKYYVKSINYINYTIRVVDANLQPHAYPSLPPYSLSSFNFDNDASYLVNSDDNSVLIYLRCPNIVGSPALNDNISSCMNNSQALVSHDLFLSLEDLGLRDSCRIESIHLISWLAYSSQPNISCTLINDLLLYGFQLSWRPAICKFNGYVYLDDDGNPYSCRHFPEIIIIDLLFILPMILQHLPVYLAFFCGSKFVHGAPCVLLLCIYKWRRRHLSMYDAIEDFLRSDNNIMPIRYSYRDIKRIAEQFKTKLGNGGYGSVFKGQLRSGRFVAVKILDKAKANGLEFINEVATIGRIHHVNVVQLTGFCVEGSKRALIYEFMPNGSLEKYIFSHEHTSSLSYKKLYDIALGVARGIEYLHNGCNMKILHFDIKPHNILLDENFNPKVSDFGLARLCPTDNSVVSLTAARGPIGYMAPELFYRNVGTVSYKADVYSFGMLLMEMAGRRKNLNALAEQSSQIYFPFWIYDQLHDGRKIIIENDMEEEDMNLAKKMMIVALWCIQTKPSDRPPMDKVLEMLEQENELQMPSKPYLYPEDLPAEDVRDYSNSRPSSDASGIDSKKSI